MMDILEFLESERQRSFMWGETDCATTADRWFQIVRGFSPMARCGRHVTDETDGREWMALPGGIIRAAKTVARLCGVTVLKREPLRGDIGIVIVDDRACIAIFDGEIWNSRDEDGLIVANDTHRFVAWEVSICPRR